GLTPHKAAVEGHVDTPDAVAVTGHRPTADGERTGANLVAVGGREDVAVERQARQRDAFAWRDIAGVRFRRQDAVIECLEVVLRRDRLHGDGSYPFDASGPDVAGHHHSHRAAVRPR